MQIFRILQIAILLLTCSAFAAAQQTLENPSTRVQQPNEKNQQDVLPATDEKSDQGPEAPPSEVPKSEKPAEVQEPDDSRNSEKKESDDDSKQENNRPDNAKTKKESGESNENNKQRVGKKTRISRRASSKRNEQFISAFSPAVSSIAGSVVKIVGGKHQVALGTVIESDGLILTKASELKGDLRCELPDGTSLKPSVVGVDPETDLVLLKIDVKGLSFVRLTDELLPDVGSWLITVDQDEVPLTVGIVSHDARKIAKTALNSAVIGIFPEDREKGEGVRINRISSDTPAEEAGLLVNDVIVAIDSDRILNRAELMEKLSHFHPGDDIVLKIQRGEEELDVPLTLGKRRINPMMDRGNRQNRMGSTLSKRRSNFPLALQHDSTLNANEVGGPVVDIDGRVIGINIARDGRVSSLVLPNQVIIPIIAKLKSGEFTPNIVNKTEIEHVEKQLARLAADMGDLPNQKTKKEIEFSAGAAVEKELELQLKDVQDRLKALQARFDAKKKSNETIIKEITEIESKRKRIERKREPLQQDLKRLKTGVK